jgi:two-component system response regulator RegA
LPALGRSFERRGYQVILATNFDEASALLEQHCPDYAVVDLKLNGNTSGLACVQMLHQHDPEMLIVVLTGYASIGTAVEAIKLGACQYLAKPSNTDDIEAAFGHVAGNADIELTGRATNIKTLEWERIHEMLAETDFNLRNGPPPGHAPAHPGAQIGKAAGEVGREFAASVCLGGAARPGKTTFSTRGLSTMNPVIRWRLLRVKRNSSWSSIVTVYASSKAGLIGLLASRCACLYSLPSFVTMVQCTLISD